MLIEKALRKAKKQSENKDEQTVQRPAFAATGPGSAEVVPRTTERQTSNQVRSRAVELDQDHIACQRCLCEASTPKEIESYKILRTRIYHRMKDKGWKTVMVTSPGAGEGKTLTAVNLAFSFAKFYHQTAMLVDCDFRRQSIHKCLGYVDSSNLIDHILDHVPLQDTMVRIGSENLVVISGERVVDDSAEILGTPQVMHCVGEMKDRYNDRTIIFDLPPVLYTADALTFAQWVDGILMVVQAGKTSMKDLKKAVELLPREKFLGYALNRSRISISDYYKNYYYLSDRASGKDKKKR